MFAVLLVLPAIDMAADIDPAPALRDGALDMAAPSPAMILRDFRASGVEEFFARRSGFRDSLVRAYNTMMVMVLRASPGGLYDLPDAPGQSNAAQNAIVGEHGWLFFAGPQNRVVADHRGIVPFTQEELRTWKARLEERRDWLAARGIAYVFLIAPDKHSIYPEHLPARLQGRDRPGRQDQLLAYLRAESDVWTIDLRPALLAAKHAFDRPVYHKTDTHWNGLGAYVAYRAMVEELQAEFPRMAPKPLEEFEVTVRTTPGKDLARFLGMEHVLQEESVELAPRFERVAARTTEGVVDNNPQAPDHVRPFAMTTRNEALPRALMLRDSFTTALVPLLSEHFEYIAYYWPRFGRAGQIPFTGDLVEAARPDVVIEEWVERDLLYSVPENRLE